MEADKNDTRRNKNSIQLKFHRGALHLCPYQVFLGSIGDLIMRVGYSKLKVIQTAMLYF